MGAEGRVGGTINYMNRISVRIIGIVEDHLFNNMYAATSPLLLFTRPKKRGRYIALNIRLKPVAGLTAALAKVEAIVKANNPGFPFEYQFANDKFQAVFVNETRIGRLAGVFAGLAILISCLGLFGLAAYTAELRTKEIGIRKLLGASAWELAAMLVKEFVQLVGLACVIAFPVAWAFMDDWLADYAYRIAIHWWVFGITGVAALSIALLTVSFQTMRTALSNPVDSLRSE